MVVCAVLASAAAFAVLVPGALASDTPSGTLAVTAAPNGPEGTKVIAVTVSGEDPEVGYVSDASLPLLVVLEPAASPCPSQPPKEVSWEVTVDTLHFSKATQLGAVPYGSWRVCAYLPYEETSSGFDEVARGEAAVMLAAPAAARLTSFRVVARAASGTSAKATFRKPGWTSLEVNAPGEPYGLTYTATISGPRYRRTFHGTVEDSPAPEVGWSCAHPGTIYHYEVTVTDAYGRSLTQTGAFRTGSARYCHTLLAAEAAQQQRVREQEAHRRRALEKERREVERVKTDQRYACEHNLGGYVEEAGPGDAPFPPGPEDVLTLCYADGENIELAGDPPRVVSAKPGGADFPREP